MDRRSYHGTGEQAIEFALDNNAAWSFEREFLKSWMEGDLDEWPEFYVWLDSRPALPETEHERTKP